MKLTHSWPLLCTFGILDIFDTGSCRGTIYRVYFRTMHSVFAGVRVHTALGTDIDQLVLETVGCEACHRIAAGFV